MDRNYLEEETRSTYSPRDAVHRHDVPISSPSPLSILNVSPRVGAQDIEGFEHSSAVAVRFRPSLRSDIARPLSLRPRASYLKRDTFQRRIRVHETRRQRQNLS